MIAELDLPQNQIASRFKRGTYIPLFLKIGNYIVDFYFPVAKLILEVDGGHHYSSENIQKDKKREDYLINLGFTVLRFSDRDIFKNIDSVLEEIFDHL